MGTIRRLIGRPAHAVSNAAAPAARWIKSRTRSNGSKVVTKFNVKETVNGQPNTPRTMEMNATYRNLRKENIKSYLSNRSETMDKAKLLDKLATFKDGTLMTEDRLSAYHDDKSDKNALFDAVVNRAANKYSLSDRKSDKFIVDLENHISSN